MSTASPAAQPAGARSAQGVGLALAGVVSLQYGAALAATLFDRFGPLGTVATRLAGAAVALLIVARPRPRSLLRAGAWRPPLLMGAVMAVMNSCVYLSIDRLPLGAVITFEFLGPLGLAVCLSRRRADFLWAALAAGGVVLLGGSLHHLDPVGVGLALAAACCWAAYILVNQRMGARGPEGLRDLALAAAIGAVGLAPIGVGQAGRALLDPRLLVVGLLVGVLSSAVPYALDQLALRRLSPRVFGVLMSLDPAVAAVAGWLVLGQGMTAGQAGGVALVVAAGAGAAGGDGRRRRPAPEAAAGPVDEPEFSRRESG